MNKFNEKNIKGWLKKSIKITLASLVLFAITGTASYSAEIKIIEKKDWGQMKPDYVEMTGKIKEGDIITFNYWDNRYSDNKKMSFIRKNNSWECNENCELSSKYNKAFYYDPTYKGGVIKVDPTNVGTGYGKPKITTKYTPVPTSSEGDTGTIDNDKLLKTDLSNLGNIKTEDLEKVKEKLTIGTGDFKKKLNETVTAQTVKTFVEEKKYITKDVDNLTNYTTTINLEKDYVKKTDLEKKLKLLKGIQGEKGEQGKLEKTELEKLATKEEIKEILETVDELLSSTNVDINKNIDNIDINKKEIKELKDTKITSSDGKSIIVGHDSIAENDEDSPGIAIGNNVNVLGEFGVGIGEGTNIGKFEVPVAIGAHAQGQGDYAIAIGAVSSALEKGTIAIGRQSVASAKDSIAVGSNTDASGGSSIAIGNGTFVMGENTIAIGKDIMTSNNNAIVLGNESTGEDNTVSVGSEKNKRRIINVADGTKDSDAVNMGQLKKISNGAETITSNEATARIEGDRQLDNRIDETTALSSALASIEYPKISKGEVGVGAGVSGYRGKTGVAVGVAYMPVEDMLLGLKYSGLTHNRYRGVISASASYKFRLHD